MEETAATLSAFAPAKSGRLQPFPLIGDQTMSSSMTRSSFPPAITTVSSSPSTDRGIELRIRRAATTSFTSRFPVIGHPVNAKSLPTDSQEEKYLLREPSI